MTNLHAIWIAIMDFAMLLAAMEPTSAFANLAGEERAVTSADHIGDVPTKKTMLATILMNACAIRMRLILKACATMKF